MEKVDTISQLVALRAGLSELADDVDKLNKHKNDLDSINHAFEDDCLQLKRNSRVEKELAQEIEDIERHKYYVGIDYCDKRGFSVNTWIRYKDSLKEPYKPYLHLFDDIEFIFPLAIIIAVIGCVVSFFIAFFSLGDIVAVWLPWVVKVGSFVVISLIGLIILAIKNTIVYKHSLRQYSLQQKSYDEGIQKIDSYIKGGAYLKELKEAYTSIQENQTALRQKIEKENDKINHEQQQISALHQSISERYDKLSTYYSPLLHQSDFDKIDYIIYLFDTNRRLKDAMLFNVLSYMTNELLGKGNTVAAIDELYLFLTNMTAIEYIRNASKRVRKKDSSVILASQNIDDFLIDGVKEYTKPLFSIPTHQFLFNAGNIEPKVYIDTMQLEQSEFDLIKYPERGTCLYRCGNERYLLQVIAPDFKQKMFGKAGGR